MALDYEVYKLFEQMELELIKNMRRNLKSHKQQELDEGFSWEMWQSQKLRELKKYMQHNRQIIGDTYSIVTTDVAETLRNSYTESANAVDDEMRYALDNGHTLSIASPPEFGIINDKKVNTLINAVNGDMRTACTAVLRQMDDVYRRTVFNAAAFASTGVETVDQAVDRATKDFLSKGIDCITYKDGRKVNIASYARMAVRTANKRAHLKGEGDRRAEWGECLVYVSQYGRCSPTCLPWQGRVYIDDVYAKPSAEQLRKYKRYPLLSEAIKGGLFHPNCRHTMSTFFEDVNTVPPRMDEDEIKERYEQLQKKNYCEHMVQKYRRLRDGSCDSKERKKYADKVRQWKDKLEEVNTSAQKAVAKKSESGIINYAKDIDVFNYDKENIISEKSPEKILEDLQTSNIGKEVFEALQELPERPLIDYITVRKDGVKGEQQGNRIVVYANSCKDLKTVVCTLIHEYTHYKYGIGQSQWAECVCVAKEILHRRQRDYLLPEEIKMIIKAVKEVYPEYNWRKGGIINGRRIK